MEIKIQLKGKVFFIQFGRNTQWYWSAYLIGWGYEYYNDKMEVEFATYKGLFRSKSKK